MKKRPLEDLEVFMHHYTDKAYLVSVDGDRDKAVWLPASMCEVDAIRIGPVVLTAEQSFLEDKGLV